MWNENAPLELLKEMPRVLTVDNLSKIQEVIDGDKFINSQIRNADLCGEYAPFCDNCDKSVKYPCAVAYVKMMQSQGLDVEIEAPAEEQPEEVQEEVEVVAEPEPQPEPEPIVEEEVQPVEEEIVVEEPVEEPVEEQPKSSGIKIRIAIVRRRV